MNAEGGMRNSELINFGLRILRDLETHMKCKLRDLGIEEFRN